MVQSWAISSPQFWTISSQSLDNLVPISESVQSNKHIHSVIDWEKIGRRLGKDWEKIGKDWGEIFPDIGTRLSIMETTRSSEIEQKYPSSIGEIIPDFLSERQKLQEKISADRSDRSRNAKACNGHRYRQDFVFDKNRT